MPYFSNSHHKITVGFRSVAMEAYAKRFGFKPVFPINIAN